MDPRPHLSVVAPFFNEAQSLSEFVRRAVAACRAVCQERGASYEAERS